MSGVLGVEDGHDNSMDIIVPKTQQEKEDDRKQKLKEEVSKIRCLRDWVLRLLESSMSELEREEESEADLRNSRPSLSATSCTTDDRCIRD